jgi:subtilisin family serine protease
MKWFLRAVIFLVVAVGVALGQSLNKHEAAKLHPTFQAVLSHHTSQRAIQSSVMPPEAVALSQHGEPVYEAIILTSDVEAVRRAGVHVNSAFESFVTARLTAEELLRLVRMPGVRSIDPGSINFPQLDLSVPEMGVNLLHSGFLNNTSYKGKGVIVVIYDTGIDFRHLDFRDPLDTTKSRILFIWDQTITAGAGENPPAGYSYGVEYTKAHIEDEIDGTPKGYVRQRDTNGHGTHVAGTAVGNGASYGFKYIGVAPEADIIVVKGGDGSFSEPRMIDGLNYARTKALERAKPVVVNWSIGGQSGPHDGTRSYEVAVNHFVGSPGRVVAISAGNDGASPIHVGGNLSSGATATFTLTVPSYTPTSGTANDQFLLDLWFDGPTNATITATVTSPGGVTYTRSRDETGTAPNTTDGTIDLYNYVSNLNGQRNILLYVRDATASSPAPRSGTWTLTLSNVGASMQYDGWLALRTVGNQTVTLSGGNTSKTVSMPGTAQGAITVASYVTKWSWTAYDGRGWTYTGTNRTSNISTFSSIGPTRDGRMKPDIAAPGQGISAALSAAVDTSTLTTRMMPGIRHYLTQGTSMSSPHVAGVAALMLGAKPTLTAEEIKSYLVSTAQSDRFTGSLPNVVWGYGKADAYRALEKVVGGAGAARATLSYAGPSRFFITLPSTNQKFAMRFTPTFSGRVASISLHLNSSASAIKGNGSLAVSITENIAGSIGGIPGAQRGGSITVPFSSLTRGSSNVIDFTFANVSVVNGEDFHVVWEVIGTVGDTLQFLLDDGTTSPTNRASAFRNGVNGLGWYNRADPNYQSGRTPSFENFLVSVVIASPTTGVYRISERTPSSFLLEQNYPNPFNPTTTIRYALPAQGHVRLRVFDVVGREVATLVNEEQSAGVYRIEWDGKNGFGDPVATGVYFYRLESGSFVQTHKMLLLR